MTELAMNSHTQPADGILVGGHNAGLIIVSPPRSGSRFMLDNLRNSLQRFDGTESDGTGEHSTGYGGIIATSYLSALNLNKDIISIVRKPADWIASLVSVRLFLEGRTDISSLVDEELAAAEIALKEYRDFGGDRILFVKFEDVVFRFYKTVRKIAELFGYETKEHYGHHFGSIKIGKDTPLNPLTSTRLSNHPSVVDEVSKRDLSKVNALYEELLAKTIEVNK